MDGDIGEFVGRSLKQAIAAAGMDDEMFTYAQTDKRLGQVLDRGLSEVANKGTVTQRLKVNSIINWYARLLAKEVKAVS